MESEATFDTDDRSVQSHTLAAAKKIKLSCRLCLSPKQDVNLFNNPKFKFCELAFACTNIEVTNVEEYPDMICEECASKLRMFHDFRKKCQIANYRMETIINLSKAIQEEMASISSSIIVEDHSDVTVKYESPDIIQVDYIDLGDVAAEDDVYVEHEDSDKVVSTTGDENILEEELIQETFEEMDIIDECDQKDDGDDEELENLDVVITPRNRVPQNVETFVEPTSPTIFIGHIKNPNRQCEHCGRVFSRKSTLDQHRITHTGVKNFSCDICDTRFTRKSHLEIHKRIHDNIKPYVCSQCGRSFVKSSDLFRHRRIHSDDRDFECKMCSKRFKRSADVVTHMRSHTGHKPYKCIEMDCDKSYTSHSSLKKHMLSMHAQIGSFGMESA